LTEEYVIPDTLTHPDLNPLDRPWGCIWYVKSALSLRQKPHAFHKGLMDKVLEIIKKYEKKGMKFFGSYGPVLGTNYSDMIVLEFPSYHLFHAFRREALDAYGIYGEITPMLAIQKPFGRKM
jgi:hypothetical protein